MMKQGDGEMGALRQRLRQVFDKQHPDFAARIKVGRTCLADSVLRVSLQVDRVAHAAVMDWAPAPPSAACAVCSAVRKEWHLPLGGHIIIGYDFPPFRYQFMVATADHRVDLRPSDILFVYRLAKNLNCHAFFAGPGSGASCPGHVHFHLVSFPSFTRVPPVCRVGALEAVQNVAGRVTAIRSGILREAEIAYLLDSLSAAMKPGGHGYNAIITGRDLYLVPRRFEYPPVWPERLGAIEMGGLFCVRNQVQLAEYKASPDSFHNRFLAAQEEACLPAAKIVDLTVTLAGPLGDGGEANSG